MQHVFVTYSDKDARYKPINKVVEHLGNTLDESSIPWVSDQGLHLNRYKNGDTDIENQLASIQEQIATAGAMIVVFSQSSPQSLFLDCMVDYAHRSRIPILVMYDSRQPPPTKIRDARGVEFPESKQAWTDLVELVRALLSKHPLTQNEVNLTQTRELDWEDDYTLAGKATGSYGLKGGSRAPIDYPLAAYLSFCIVYTGVTLRNLALDMGVDVDTLEKVIVGKIMDDKLLDELLIRIEHDPQIVDRLLEYTISRNKKQSAMKANQVGNCCEVETLGDLVQPIMV